jgi:hypothetical protein
MAEWLILLLLVPAIVVPVALFAGFAGCSFEHGQAGEPTPEPIILGAVGQDVSTIRLSWGWALPAQTFWIERTRSGPLPAIRIVSVPGSPPIFDDMDGLEAVTSYKYRVGGQQNEGSAVVWSPPVTGTTLGFEETFRETLTLNNDGWEGYTLVQRIEATALMGISRTQVKQVRITLHASADFDASIDRIFISGPSSASGANAYDSDPTDLTEVPLPQTPFVVPAGGSRELPPVNYIVQPGSQALLIAVDFTPGSPPSGVKAAVVSSARARAWWFQYDPDPPPPAPPRSPEAGIAPRSAGYDPAPDGAGGVYLIGQVDIG